MIWLLAASPDVGNFILHTAELTRTISRGIVSCVIGMQTSFYVQQRDRLKITVKQVTVQASHILICSQLTLFEE